MNKSKREELEIIADLLYEWAAKYGEPYVTMNAFNESDRHSAMAWTDTGSEDHNDMRVYKDYETPAAATPGESN